MRFGNWRSSAASALLFTVLIPLLAACGGTATTPSTNAPAATTAPAAAAATTAPAADAPTTAPAAVEPTVAATEPAVEPAPSGDTGNAEAGVLRYNLGGEPSTADPQKMSFSDEITFGLMNYQPLMSFGLDMQPIPGAAESFSASEDGKVYTFKLRPDSKYSDGSPLTAANFEYAWKRLADPEVAGEYQFIGCGVIVGYSEYAVTSCPDAEGNTKTITEAQELDLAALRDGMGVKAIDDTTLEITLVEPTPYFPSMAALWIGAPVRQEDVDKGADWWYDPENFIGNGPFVLTEWDHESRAVWEANPNWALGPLKLKRVEMAMITEGQVAFQAYQNGELDIVGLSAEDLASVESDPVLAKEVLDLAPRYSFYLGFNLNRPPFDNKLVRQAFAQAIDRESYASDVQGGLAQAAYSFIPPGIPGYVEGKKWEFNAEAAKATLAEAGFPNGEGLPELKLTYGQSARNQTRFEWMANQFKQNLGIDVVLDPVDANAYSELTKDPSTTPQMFFLGWGPDFPDPQNYYSTVFKTGTSSAAETSFSNKAFDDLTVQADRELDPAKRTELYNQASDILLEESPVVFLYYGQGRDLMKPYVKGISKETITPLDFILGSYNLQNISVEP